MKDCIVQKESLIKAQIQCLLTLECKFQKDKVFVDLKIYFNPQDSTKKWFKNVYFEGRKGGRKGRREGGREGKKEGQKMIMGSVSVNL